MLVGPKCIWRFIGELKTSQNREVEFMEENATLELSHVGQLKLRYSKNMSTVSVANDIIKSPQRGDE